jgi:excisionase family DNA binding protein
MGIRVNVAEWNYQAGRPLYDGKILDLLKASDCMIVILTRAAFMSPDIQQEIGAIWIQGKPIVALVENGIQLPGVLNGREVVFFDSASWSARLGELLRHVRYWREQKQQKWLSRGIASAAAVALGLFVNGQSSDSPGPAKARSEGKLLTISDAARYAGYSESSVRRWIRDGDLPFGEDRYGTRYVPKAELDAFLIATGRA